MCVNIFLWIRPRQPLWSIIPRPLAARGSKGCQIPHDKGINYNQLLLWRLDTHLLQMHLLGQLTTCHELCCCCSCVGSKENGEDKEIKKAPCGLHGLFHSSSGSQTKCILESQTFPTKQSKGRFASALNLISELHHWKLLPLFEGDRAEWFSTRSLTEILLRTSNRSFLALCVKTLWNRSASLWNSRQRNCPGMDHKCDASRKVTQMVWTSKRKKTHNHRQTL